MLIKFFIIILLQSILIFAQNYKLDPVEESKISDLISKMTIDEKIGQLVQKVGTWNADLNLIREGKIGSFLLGVNSPGRSDTLQRIAVQESRLGIPLLFANDIIHGYTTIFPIPLAEASSWNPELVKEASSIAAFESAAEGTHWTYAPMVDITRDPRWGRIMEGSGEDPYLGSIMASARVRGFQGDDIKDKSKIAACAKHYVAYGGAEGGRDYNTVDISESTLREVYLPPFKAAVESGAASIMSAFNDLNGIPASANYFTLTEVLRNEWNWHGVVISDYNSVGELVKHRFAKDKKDAALKGLSAGVDVDMVGDTIDGDVYSPHLKNLFEDGLINEVKINEAAARVLRLKYKLGLFENPYIDHDFYKKNNLSKTYKDSIALQLAKESIVLLKNEKNILPLKKNIKSIALIGPLADNTLDLLGGWSGAGRKENVISVLQGIKNILPGNININYEQGCGFVDSIEADFEKVIEAVNKSEAAVVVVGESRDMSGEAASKTNLNLPEIQEELVQRIYQTGVPTIVVLMNGRPLTINWINENVPAVIEAWYLGDQAGNAIAQVLFGDYNPSGKLPITFPLSTGQIPVYHYQKSTGRPIKEEDKYTSKYLDSPNTPLYPFGFGLSYTTFVYSNLKSSRKKISPADSFMISADISNTGKVQGEEVVQLYIRDDYASVTRPVKELKGFQKIKLKPGETKTIQFKITPEMLSILNKDLHYVVEPGIFTIMIGGNSVDLLSESVEVSE